MLRYGTKYAYYSVIFYFTPGPACPEHMKYTSFTIGDNGRNYICGGIEDELLPNSSVVIVECGEPRVGSELTITRTSGGPYQTLLSFCEVHVTGYLYKSKWIYP